MDDMRGATPEAACQGKYRYPSMRDARKVAARVNASRKSRNGKAREYRGKNPVMPFRCEFCHGWHLGAHMRKIKRPRDVQRQKRNQVTSSLRIAWADR